MGVTNIEWVRGDDGSQGHSINPIRARLRSDPSKVGHYCEKIAPGCANCYSSAFQPRFGLPQFGSGQKRDDVEIFLDESKLEEVRHRRKPTRYFWCSMTDIFGDWMQPEWLKAIFETIDATPQHTHQLLTKRPQNVRKMWPYMIPNGHDQCPDCGGLLDVNDECPGWREGDESFHIRYRPNVWLLASISDQPTADAMIPRLLECRDLVPVLGVSAEPLLGPVDLEWCGSDEVAYGRWNALTGEATNRKPGSLAFDDSIHPNGTGPLDWVVVGCESGHRRRPMQQAWAQSLVDQCSAASVPVFVKQIELDGKVSGDIQNFPQSLQIREFPSSDVIHNAV